MPATTLHDSTNHVLSETCLADESTFDELLLKDATTLARVKSAQSSVSIGGKTYPLTLAPAKPDNLEDGLLLLAAQNGIKCSHCKLTLAFPHLQVSKCADSHEQCYRATANALARANPDLGRAIETVDVLAFAKTQEIALPPRPECKQRCIQHLLGGGTTVDEWERYFLPQEKTLKRVTLSEQLKALDCTTSAGKSALLVMLDEGIISCWKVTQEQQEEESQS